MKKWFLFLSYILICNISFSQQHVTSVVPNAITILPANDAVLTNGLRTIGSQDLVKDPKVFAIQGWKDQYQSFTWNDICL